MARSLIILAIGMFLGVGASARQQSCPDPAPGTGSVVGRVIDAATGVTLGFAQLRLQGAGLRQDLEARSDSRGHFAFCGVPPGRVSVLGVLGQLSGGVGPLDVARGERVDLTLELRSAGQNTGTLAGKVVDAETGQAVEGASIFIRDLALSTLSNELGRFAFPSVPPGIHTVRTERIGYAEAEGAVEVERWRATETRISLATKAISLDPIVVTAVRRRVDLPDIEDFERRYYSGWGEFVLEDQIQMRSPMKLTDVLTDTGLEITGNGTSVIVRRTNCAPMVYIDNVKMTNMPRAGGGKGNRNRLYAWPDPENSPEEEAAHAINMVHPSNVLAVEVYKGPASTPGQYIDSNSRCGVVVIWTRRGR